MEETFRNNFLQKRKYNNGRNNFYENRRGRGHSNNFYANYYARNNKQVFQRNYKNKQYVKQNRKNAKLPSRSSTPDEGSEEFMNQKIQKTSAIIMRHLLSPEETIIPLQNDIKTQQHSELESKEKIQTPTENKRKRNESTNESSSSSLDYIHKHKKYSSYNIGEIHNKIMHHLTNLNEGKKKNLISNRTSAYDDAINQIVKQKRLEISRALRSMCLKSSDVTESTEWINSIIPDMGIKIEELPREVLEELESTFSKLESFEVDLDLHIHAETSPNASMKDLYDKRQDISETTLQEVLVLNDDLISDNEEQAGAVKEDILEDRSTKSLCPGPHLDLNVGSGSKDLEVSTSTSQLKDNPYCLDTYVEYHLDTNVEPESDVKNTIQQESLENVDKLEDMEAISPESTFSEPENLNTNFVQTNQEILTSKQSSEKSEKITMEDFLETNFKEPPKNYSEAIDQMFILDKYIQKLIAFRQKMFTDIRHKKNQPLSNTIGDEPDKKKRKKKNLSSPTVTKVTEAVDQIKVTVAENTPSNNLSQDSNLKANEQSSCSFPEAVPKVTISNDQKLLEFKDIQEKILVLKVFEERLLAATESGKIYFYNLKSGDCENILNVTSVPICALAFKKQQDDKPYLFVGSCESSLKVLNLYSGSLLENFPLDDSIQCMDENWGYLFLGCLRGTVIRYSIKKRQVEDEGQFNSNPVLVIRATQEGARRVLLIGSRNSPVIVRDAMSGLHLRKFDLNVTTVYSIVMHKHYVICGTTNYDILVFNFYNGTLEHTFKATQAKGVSTMKVVGNCLFASCYNGFVYVFNLTKKSLIGTLCGPGGVIISMEVLCNQVIVGTMSFKFTSIPISGTILRQMT